MSQELHAVVVEGDAVLAASIALEGHPVESVVAQVSGDGLAGGSVHQLLFVLVSVRVLAVDADLIFTRTKTARALRGWLDLAESTFRKRVQTLHFQ